jgi:hypothetical protein
LNIKSVNYHSTPPNEGPWYFRVTFDEYASGVKELEELLGDRKDDKNNMRWTVAQDHPRSYLQRQSSAYGRSFAKVGKPDVAHYRKGRIIAYDENLAILLKLLANDVATVINYQ